MNLPFFKQKKVTMWGLLYVQMIVKIEGLRDFQLTVSVNS